LEQKTNDFADFANLPQPEQNEKLADILTELSQNGEFVIIDDQNGVYTDEGYYHPYMEALIRLIVGSPKPVVGFVQSRMMPFAAREKHRGSYHRFLKLFPMKA